MFHPDHKKHKNKAILCIHWFDLNKKELISKPIVNKILQFNQKMRDTLPKE